MRNLITTGFLAAGIMLAGAAATPALAKKKAAKPPPAADTGIDPSLHKKLLAVKRAYRQGELAKPAAWAQLSWLHDRGEHMTKADRVSLLETQAVMLQEANYPILAAIYASQAVKLSTTPLAAELEPAWEILRRVSERKPIQSVLEIVADNVDLRGRKAPVFGSDWNYFAGNAAARRNEPANALKFYGDLGLDDRYFFPAKYQQAMILVDQDKLGPAEVALKAILYPTASKLSPLESTMQKQMADYAMVALGRIYYETKRFDDSIKMYRGVSRSGANFYDALFEQSWAFFMAGYPMHALGALYAVESPFYKEVFNPEAPMLRAMVHYWLCRYEDSRGALADFMERYEPQVEKLDEFLGRQHLDAETAYTLFENLVTGVSDDSLGVPRTILKTAAEKDSMLLLRDQYAAILEEKNRLESKGIFGDKGHTGKPMDYMDRWATALRKDVGKHFLIELTDLKKDYDRLYAQGQFLYVELLESEKDQLLGKELHADTKITHVSQKMKVSGWADKTQAWKDSRIGEYWWDEVGYYITPVDSMCTVRGNVAH